MPEAFAAGLPIVATAVGGLPSVVDAGVELQLLCVNIVVAQLDEHAATCSRSAILAGGGNVRSLQRRPW